LPRRRPSASRFRAPLTRWERKLRLDEDHRRAARELLMQKYNASKHGNDFLRPLVYPPHVASSDRFCGTDLNQFHRTKTEFFVTP
jgi:hypothetical protein